MASLRTSDVIRTNTNSGTNPTIIDGRLDKYDITLSGGGTVACTIADLSLGDAGHILIIECVSLSGGTDMTLTFTTKKWANVQTINAVNDYCIYKWDGNKWIVEGYSGTELSPERDIGEWTYTRTSGTHGGNRVGDESWVSGSSGTTIIANRWFRTPFTTEVTGTSWCTFVAAGSGTSTTASTFTLSPGTYKLKYTQSIFYASQSGLCLASEATAQLGASTAPTTVLSRAIGYYAGFAADPGQSAKRLEHTFTLSSSTTLCLMRFVASVHTSYACGISVAPPGLNEIHAKVTIERLD